MAPPSAPPPHLSIEGERVQLAAPNPKARHDARPSEGHGASSAVVADDPSCRDRGHALARRLLSGLRHEPGATRWRLWPRWCSDWAKITGLLLCRHLLHG